MTDTRSDEREVNDDGLKVSVCSGEGCGAKIVWTESMAGRRMPLDAVPNPAGAFVIEDRGSDRLISHRFSGTSLEAMKRRGTSIYQTHWATCPDAARFRPAGG